MTTNPISNPTTEELKEYKATTILLDAGQILLRFYPNAELVTGMPKPDYRIKNVDIDFVIETSLSPSREGYSFAGWNGMADGSGATYLPGAVYKSNTGIELYAQWIADTGTQTQNQEKPTGVQITNALTRGGKGTLTSTTVAMQYRTADDRNTWYWCTAGSTAVPAGEYWVRYAPKEGFYASPETYVGKVLEPAAPPVNADFTFTTTSFGTSNGIITQNKTNITYEYRLPDTTLYKEFNNGQITNLSAGYIYIRVKEVRGVSLASGPLPVSVKHSSPSGLDKADATIYGGNGSITGTNTNMQYRTGYEQWMDCSAPTTAVSAGTYQVRYKSSNVYEPSDAISITVGLPEPVATINFTTHPVAVTTVREGNISGELTVTAGISQEKEVTYKWYRCHSSGSIFGDALYTGANFIIPTNLTKGTYYYCCQATSLGATTVKSNIAKVTVEPRIYTVKYDGNGSTDGSMASSSFKVGDGYELTANDFTREYTVNFNYNGVAGGASQKVTFNFTGWKTNNNGTGTSYSDIDYVTNLSTTHGATVTLYAQWQSTSITLPTPTRTGYTFGGWYSDSNCTAANRIGGGGANYTPTANQTIYAKWIFNTYTITLDITTVVFDDRTEGYKTTPAANSITITNTGNCAISGYTVSGGESAFIITHTPATIASGGTGIFNVQPNTGLTAGTYNADIIVTTSAGTTKIMHVSFTVYSAPIVSISGITSIRQGESTTLTAMVSGGKTPYTYLWNTMDMSSDIIVSPRTSATYTVTIEDALGARISVSHGISVLIPTYQNPAPTEPVVFETITTPKPSATPIPSATPKPSTVPEALDSSNTTEIPTPTNTLEPPQTSDITEKFPEKIEEIEEIELFPAEDILNPEIRSEVKKDDVQALIYDYGDGQVIVVVPPYEGTAIAKIHSEQDVIKAVLTPEELGEVANGATIEIKLDVKRIVEETPAEDRQTIEEAVGTFEQEIPELTLGSYLDISLSKCINGGKWQPIPDAGKTIQVVIDIPEELIMEATEYYILRSHEGGCTLLEDQDDDPKTITILTQYFSTYAIAYQAEKNKSVCIWHWIVLGMAILSIILLVAQKDIKSCKKYIFVCAIAVVMFSIGFIGLVSNICLFGIVFAIISVLLNLFLIGMQLFRNTHKKKVIM